MRGADFYRYFLGFRPSPDLSVWLDRLRDEARQVARIVRSGHFHLTLFVIAEPPVRDRFLAARVRAALAGHGLCACPFSLGLVRGGDGGAAVHAVGRQDALQDFYRLLRYRLALRGMHPLHRQSGLRPHVTLGYDPCAFEPFTAPREWIPDELLLIESEVGAGIHNLLARWPLLPPRQGVLPFDVTSDAPVPAFSAAHRRRGTR